MTDFPFAHFPSLITTNQAEAVSDDVIPVLELEGGLEWGRDTRAGRLSARASFVGQAWFGVGNLSDSERTTIGLFGAAVSAGWQY